jgi:hypothetical protein
MPPNGYFSFVYSGESGLGCGFFELLDGKLRGFDYAQAVYRGHVVDDAGYHLLQLEATYPPGTVPISGGSTQEIPLSRKLSIRLPANFDNGQPIKAEAPGDITLMISRLSPDWEEFGARAATKGFKLALNG